MNILEWNHRNIGSIVNHLNQGKVAVLPTDTIYGLVAAARNEEAFKRIYQLKLRNPNKKCIVLISNIDDLKLFDVDLTKELKTKLKKYWPGKVSIELSCTSEKMKYLRCKTNSLSFRLPGDELLCELLKKTGPLVAPSANPESLEPATNIELAQAYFKDEDLLFVDAGEKISPPSTLISLLDEEVQVIRGSLKN